jgi:hypothetical protein
MSDLMPGTLVQMRTLRRFAHYMAGEMIAVPYEAARDLDARRLAQPIHFLVPPARAVEAAPEGAEGVPQMPMRQPGGVVRK